MTTASGDSANVNQSVQEDCDGYLLKPVDGRRLLSDLRTLGLLPF
jgi:AmiR/NasT family two-component response regulator